MATVTTSAHLDPACFAPSNLWFEVRPPGYWCNTYYPPFSSHPTEAVTLENCPFARLGPVTLENPSSDAFSCYAYARETPSGTAYSDCPEGMTVAETSTIPWLDGITIVGSTCCPTAYDFGVGNTVPTPVPSVIGGTTYPVTYTTVGMCKAASIKEFSDQQVTLTVKTSPLSTTEVAWDYDHDFLVAEPAVILKYLYPDRAAGTTSTCYGACPTESNPLNGSPTPTPAPTGTYVPPPEAPITRFTPAASCLDQSNLWLVSASCYLYENGDRPPWLDCTYTGAGEPNPSDTACYPTDSFISSDGGPKTFYSACPVGYTPAHSHTDKPFDLPRYASSKTETFDVYATAQTCCPAAFGGDSGGGSSSAVPFTYSLLSTTKTVHDGTSQAVFVYPLPWCVATGVSQLDGETVTLGLYSDSRVWDRRARARARAKRQGETYGSTTAVWDAARDTLFAQAPQVSWTVFHGTYTCYEGCDDYFTYSYSNTDPNYTPVPTEALSQREDDPVPEEEGAAEVSTTSSIAAAAPVAGMGRGDVVQAGMLSMVVVVVTVVHVAVGALL
ncbi:hypothetical protein L209DRAFT_758395 [Thermothelomyces heterothallicus CBS 203.75]